MLRITHLSTTHRLAVIGAALLVAAAIGTGVTRAAVPTAVVIQSSTVLDRTTMHPGPAGSQGTFQGLVSGTFTSSGAVNDAGDESTVVTFSGIYAPDLSSTHGVTTLTGADGTITLRWQALHHPFEDPSFSGSWVLADATGAYAGLHGSGTVTFTVSGEATLYPHLTEQWTGSLS